jgi:hypothetical protein
MTLPREGLMRPFISVEIEVHQPVPGPSKEFFRPFMGWLKGAMYRGNAVHHFRIVDADGVMWLVPPGWLSPLNLREAEMAFDQLDARFLLIMRTVPRDLIWKAMATVTGMPDGLTPAEMVARLEQQKELV